MKSIDEVFDMCESRYALVAMVSKRAREIADEASKRGDILLEKPVNIVLNNLKSGKSTIVRPGSATNLFHEDDFDVSIMAESEHDGDLPQ